ncbi:growth/differentiation factor 15-like [Lethenteron reissneri]|uniref:growth/differentiation factor 15-like n=1 Tax=Lethenteron reissneri TaxID=7753 RepID=UPI002AB5EC61|nr:growth/differentiation factor 15-like [Lethenteron reissneri]
MKMMMVAVVVPRGLLLLPGGLCVACFLGLAACAGAENDPAAAGAAGGGDAESVAAFVSLNHNNHNNNHDHNDNDDHVRFMRALFRREVDAHGRPRGGPSALPGNTARLVTPARNSPALGDIAGTAEVVTFDLRVVPRGELLQRAVLVYPGDGHAPCSLRVLPGSSVGADHGASEPADDPEPSGDPNLEPNSNPETVPSPGWSPRPTPKPELDSDPDLAQSLNGDPVSDDPEPEAPATTTTTTTTRVSLGGEWFQVDVTGPVSRLLGHPAASLCAPRRAAVTPFLLLYSDDVLPAATTTTAPRRLEAELRKRALGVRRGPPVGPVPLRESEEEAPPQGGALAPKGLDPSSCGTSSGCSGSNCGWQQLRQRQEQERQQQQEQQQERPSARHYLGAYSNGCRLRNLTINFADLGWERWVFEPRSYEAGDCRGGCPRGLLLQAPGEPNHAAVRATVEEVRPELGVGRAACVPSRYGAIGMLVWEPHGGIVYKLYMGMVALACTCR